MINYPKNQNRRIYKESEGKELFMISEESISEILTNKNSMISNIDELIADTLVEDGPLTAEDEEIRPA